MSLYGRFTLLLFTSTLLWAQTNVPTADNLIVPGLRVGPVNRLSTEPSLLRSMGRAATKDVVGIGEGICQPGLVIYKDDPTRRLAVVWNKKAPAHPAFVWICYGQSEAPCRWHTANGIGFGTTLKELERHNDKPFEMTGFGWDYGGNITSFKGGKLAHELTGLHLTMEPRILKGGEYYPEITQKEGLDVAGDKVISSSDPVMQKLNPYVMNMRLDFDETSFSDGVPCQR
jgi:hypothetical protein